MLEIVSWKVLGKFWHVLSAKPMLWQFPWKFHVSHTKMCPSTGPELPDEGGDGAVLGVVGVTPVGALAGVAGCEQGVP